MGINGVAIGTSITHFIFSTFIMVMTMKQYEDNYLRSCKFISIIYFPFVYALFLILTIDFLFQKKFDWIWQDAIYTLMKFVIFCFLYSLIFFLVRKNTVFKKFSRNAKDLLMAKIGKKAVDYN
jgi:hypothetical protein